MESLEECSWWNDLFDEFLEKFIVKAPGVNFFIYFYRFSLEESLKDFLEEQFLVDFFYEVPVSISWEGLLKQSHLEEFLVE